MYFEPADVEHLLADIAARLPGCRVIFDVVPRWFSRLTKRGLRRTKSYQLPAMPWGLNRDEVVPTLRAWLGSSVEVEILPYRMPRGLPRAIDVLFRSLPFLKNKLPTLVSVRSRARSSPAVSSVRTRSRKQTVTAARVGHRT